jgi:hypothetical protein
MRATNTIYQRHKNELQSKWLTLTYPTKQPVTLSFSIATCFSADCTRIILVSSSSLFRLSGSFGSRSQIRPRAINSHPFSFFFFLKGKGPGGHSGLKMATNGARSVVSGHRAETDGTLTRAQRCPHAAPF